MTNSNASQQAKDLPEIVPSSAAVEVENPLVVGYADPQAFRNFHAGVANREWMWANPDNGLVPLMTVDQHERIVATLCARLAHAEAAGADLARMVESLQSERASAVSRMTALVKALEPVSLEPTSPITGILSPEA